MQPKKGVSIVLFYALIVINGTYILTGCVENGQNNTSYVEGEASIEPDIAASATLDVQKGINFSTNRQ